MDYNTKVFLIFCGAASVTGALTGLGLSFTALSPLVIGGIVATAIKLRKEWLKNEPKDLK